RVLQGDKTDREAIKRLRHDLSEKRSHLCELVNQRKDGTTYDAELFITPLFDADGRLTNFIAIQRDISVRKRAENDLRRLSKVFLDSANAVFLMDLSGRITDINPAAERQYGWTRDELIGHSIKKLVPAEEHQKRDEMMEGCIRGEEIRGVEVLRVTKSGEVIPVLLTFSLLTDMLGQPTGIAAIAEDITQRKQAEESLREKEERMRTILNTAADAIITIDQRGIIDSANAATERMFGYTQGELIGQNVKMLMPSPYCDEHDGYIARYLATGQPRIIGIGREVIGRRKDGSTFPMGLSVSEVGQLGLFTGIVHDISGRRELQKHVLEIVAEEDRRIGHELHDNIQQLLTGLGLLAQSQAEALAQASSPQAGLAARLARGIREAANDVHLLSRGLVPVEVDAEGLRSALTGLAAKVSEQYGVQCDFQCAGSVTMLDNFSATHLYRIAQEAINNAIKHGGAKRIEMSLAGDEESIVLTVLDNGIGIDVQRESGPGMGLRIMDYRAGLIGATVQVAPGKDGGTMVNCKVLRGGG
ncbi:MAG: PAS domain S-box protein, partial [Planctomycetia bacterium]|nr:PAS domain S-box protein [Planctomycetia bacterium]